MSKINSRAKGAAGERELALFLKKHGVDARRGQQFSGGDESPDVISDLEWLHIECKRVESLSLYKAMDQAIEDAGGKVPSVFHRRNRREWLVVVRAEDFLDLIRKGFLG